METMTDLLSRYSTFLDKNEKLAQEKKWLDETYFQTHPINDDDWNSLEDENKQLKRIKYSTAYRKTPGFYIGIFELEERVLDLYESIESCYDKLGVNLSVLAIRLRAHLLLVKKTINRYRDVREINDFYLNELRSVIIDCMDTNEENYFIEDVNILYLKIKLEDVLNHQTGKTGKKSQ
jgi:hypothetical protein